MDSRLLPQRAAERRRLAQRMNARGVTLLEVMISMAVFAIGMVGLAHMHVIASGSNARAAKLDRANQLAAELLEYLGSLPFDHPLLDDGPGPDDDLMDRKDRFNVAVVSSAIVDHSEFDGLNGLYAYFDYAPGISNSTGSSCHEYDSTKKEPSDCFQGAFAVDVGNGKTAPDSNWPTTDFNADGKYDFERFWQVNPLVQPGGTTPYAKQVSVIVRWYDTSIGRYRRIVMLRTIYNPACLSPGGASTC